MNHQQQITLKDFLLKQALNNKNQSPALFNAVSSS
jgi:hypothetical protein